ncbi:MAG: HAD family hydrolase [Alphaproteobacteria bacterium]
MALLKPTIVIFDMDGTAVRHIDPRVLHILERVDDAAFRVKKIASWLRHGARGPLILPMEEYSRKARRHQLLVHRAIHKVRRKPVEQIVEPSPGVYEVLDFLKDHNIPMGIASNSLGKGYGHDILDKFEMNRYFRARIFREDIVKSKPSPESILKTLKEMNVSVSETDVIWYIGDRHKDITAAQAAAAKIPAKIVPIAYGVNAAIAVLEKNIGPDHIIMSYSDMCGRLKKLFA